MKQEIYILTCNYSKCRKQFESERFWARYCSDSHRQLAYAERKKEAEQPAEKEQEKGGK